MLENIRHGMASVAGYGGVGVLLVFLGFFVVDLITPGNLRKQVFVERNRNAAVLVASAIIQVALIVTAAIGAASGQLWQGIVETVVYTVIGLAILAVAFLMTDLLTPGHLGAVLIADESHVGVWVIAALNVSIGAIVASAL